jgi:hypothetical protein
MSENKPAEDNSAITVTTPRSSPGFEAKLRCSEPWNLEYYVRETQQQGLIEIPADDVKAAS